MIFLIAGGMEGELEGTLQKTCFLYNTASNTFKQLRSMNSKKCGHVLVNMNDECVYAIGGWDNQNGLSSIEKFDPAAEQWTIVKPKLNIARRGLQAVNYKKYIFVIGGLLEGGHSTDEIEKFDISKGSISGLDLKLRNASQQFDLAKMGSNEFIIGGSYAGDSVEVFEMDQEIVTERKNMPFADSFFSACVL